MSTMIALLLVLSALVGCAGETLTNVKNALPDVPAEVIAFSVEMETYEETVRDEDGAALAECSYELPVLTARLGDGSVLETAATEKQERALSAAETFNDRFAQWKTNPRTLAEAAREDQALRREEGLTVYPYEDKLTSTVYQTGRLVSVSGVYSTWTGAAQPKTILLSWNFDLEAGDFFTPDTLGESEDFQVFVQQELSAEAGRAVREMGVEPYGWYWKNYEDTLAEWSSYAVSFDETGMTVGFSPYELAAYAAGPQVFHLAYETLLPHLGQHGRALLGLEDGGQGTN